MFDNDIFQVTYTDFHVIPVVYDDSKIYVTLMCDNVSELTLINVRVVLWWVMATVPML